MRVNTGRWGTSKDFDELMENRGIEPPLPGYTEEDGFPWVIESLEKCLPAAEKCGVTIPQSIIDVPRLGVVNVHGQGGGVVVRARGGRGVGVEHHLELLPVGHGRVQPEPDVIVGRQIQHRIEKRRRILGTWSITSFR